MDRRKGGGPFTAAELGLTEEEAAKIPVLGRSFNYNPNGMYSHPKPAAPYDPVAVLEAMRTSVRFSGSQLHVTSVGYWATFHDNDRCLFLLGDGAHPDFPSAVRWLHEQAAAVDGEFAKAFPLPE